MQIMRVRLAFVMSGFVAAFGPVGFHVGPSAARAARPTAARYVVRSNTDFAFDLYAELAKANEGKNLLFSPRMEPITFQPLYMTRVWGGRSLEEAYGRTLPDAQPYGESWEISDRERDDEQSVVTEGSFAGKTLHELWQPSWRRSVMLCCPTCFGQTSTRRPYPGHSTNRGRLSSVEHRAPDRRFFHPPAFFPTCHAGPA